MQKEKRKNWSITTNERLEKDGRSHSDQPLMLQPSSDTTISVRMPIQRSDTHSAMQTAEITVLPKFPKRHSEGHKGTFGKVLLWAGSLGMTGAAILAGRAALRGGAGLVYVATPRCCTTVVACGEASYLTVPLPDDGDARTDSAALDVLLEKISSMDAVAMGPGLGQSSALSDLVLQLYQQTPLPCVVDADALNALATQPDKMTDHAGPRILTPHVGEFARLTGFAADYISANRVDCAMEFAARHRVIVILKGPGTVVTDGHGYYINKTGNPGMATGGTGDVLTGLILALLGQGCRPFEAAQLGVYLHGLAGDVAAREWTQPGLIASDLPDYLPRAIASHLA